MAKKKCDCIFCNFKCPECGSTEIEITYSPVFKCSNYTKNTIVVDRESDILELVCQECDAELEYGEFAATSEKLEVFRKILSEKLGIPNTTFFEHKDNGKILTKQTVTVTGNFSKERGD